MFQSSDIVVASSKKNLTIKEKQMEGIFELFLTTKLSHRIFCEV